MVYDTCHVVSPWSDNFSTSAWEALWWALWGQRGEGGTAAVVMSLEHVTTQPEMTGHNPRKHPCNSECLWRAWPNSPSSLEMLRTCHLAHPSVGRWDDENTTENIAQVCTPHQKWGRNRLRWQNIWVNTYKDPTHIRLHLQTQILHKV